jgi:hypothetical protein
MSNLLKNNAYHVLGLDTSSTQRDIQRRAKEIVKLVQIDDVPKYDLDLDIFEALRTEESVKEAIQKLTSPKKCIKEYFFWFHVGDDVDIQALGLLRLNKLEEALRVWEHHSAGETKKAFLYKKNLAILYCILLSDKPNQKYLKESLKIWYELCNAPKFRTAFDAMYKLQDELSTDTETISDFHHHCPSDISDLYTELSQQHKNDSYIAEFSQVFNMRGEKTAKAVLTPIFEEMTVAIEKLEAIKIPEEGELSSVDATLIKQCIAGIQNGSNKLIDLGLYDDSQSKTIRDRAAAAIRSVVLDIHNNLNDVPKAEQLLKIAMEFVGTSGMKHKLQQDLDTFESNRREAAKIQPILNLIQSKNYLEAITLIESTKELHKNDTDLLTVLDSKKKEAVTLYATNVFLEARKLMDSERYDGASPLFKQSAAIVYDHIEIFDVNREVVDSWLQTIKGNVGILTTDNAKDVDEIQNGMIKKIDEVFDGRMEQLAIKVLINSYYYAGLIQFIKRKKSSNTSERIIGWAVTIGIIWLIGAIFG